VKKKNIGSTFESWLREEGIYEEVSANAIKRVSARQPTARSSGPEVGDHRSGANAEDPARPGLGSQLPDD